MLTNQIHPTEAQIEQLKAYPKNTPITMLNILKFKLITTTHETGEEAYARYFKNIAPFVANAEAKLIWKGNVHTSFIGDLENQPQLIFLVEYPSVNHFFAMVSNPEYQKVSTDRTIALEYGGLIACKTTN
ncbi:MAG: DUF1330 domain-containing protein [Lutibacter sp.]|jgi:uncharacterized protein (DUF1330 family)|nr:DUF1330 domain-containing protein [Lutibacter sp.]